MGEPIVGPARYTAAMPMESERAGSEGIRRGYLADDAKLRRRVLLHTFDAPTGTSDRERWLDLAKRAGRLHYAGYLQVLDVLLSSEQVTIVLEAPAEAAGNRGTYSDLPALVAIALTLQVGAALEDATQHGLAATHVSNDALYFDGSDEVRIDPVVLFADVAGEVAAGTDTRAVPALCDFLHSLLADRTLSGRGFDPGAQAAASLLVRWRERSAANSDNELSSFLGELRGIPAAEAGHAAMPAIGNGTRAWAATSSTGSARDEPTVELPLGVGASAAGQRAPREGDESLAAASTSQGTFLERSGAGGGRGSRKNGVIVATLMGTTLAASALLVYAVQGSNRTGPPADTAGGVSTPAPKAPVNRASLTVTAQQSAQVRVTVDGANAFSGVMQPNESRSWDGAQRVQLWTNNGKNLLVTVNSYPLGPLSTAVGHPDWNTVDWGWGTGWTPAQSALDAGPGASQPIETGSGNGKKKDKDD